MAHFLMHYLGLNDPDGGWYLWWSGFFGDFTIFGAAIVFLFHHNCHQHRCWRLGRHPHGHYRLCRKHHPTGGRR